MLLFFLLAVIGFTITFFWSEYFPLALFLLLAFSVEIQITSTTRLTLPTELLIVALVGFTFFHIITSQKIVYRPSRLNLAVLLFYGVMLFSLFYTKAFPSTVKAFIRDTGYIVAGYYIIPGYVTSERRFKQVVFGCLIVHCLLVLYGFGTQVAGGIRIYDDIANPFFIEHCIYAAFLTITFAFLLAYLLEYEDSPHHFYLAMITAVFGIAVLLTFVRAAWISIALLLFLYLIIFRKKKSAVDLILILLIFLLSGIVMMITTDFGALFVQRFDTLTDLQYVANYDRLDRWLAAWHMWLDFMIFGVGWGAYPDIYQYYVALPNAYSSHIRMGAHNLYLELLAEIGIIGFLAFTFMIYHFFRQTFLIHKKMENRFQRVFLIGMQGAMITYLFHAFLNNLGPSDKISLTFWFLLGMTPTLNYLSERTESDTSQQDKKIPRNEGTG